MVNLEGIITGAKQIAWKVVDVLDEVVMYARYNKVRVGMALAPLPGLAYVAPVAIVAASCGPTECETTYDCGGGSEVCSSQGYCVDAKENPVEACGDSPLEGKYLNVGECPITYVVNFFFNKRICEDLTFSVDLTSELPSDEEIQTRDGFSYGFLSDREFVYKPETFLPTQLNTGGDWPIDLKLCLSSLLSRFGGFTTYLSHDPSFGTPVVLIPVDRFYTKHECGEFVREQCDL